MNDSVIKAKIDDIHGLVEMALDLWEDNEYNELKEDFEALLSSENNMVFIYKVNNESVGFIHVSLRFDYVEGSNSCPVGYIEGIYVKPEHRGKYIARELEKSGEQWALTKGCTQMASDIEQDNIVSYDFHKKIGFEEANRIICFIKDIEE